MDGDRDEVDVGAVDQGVDTAVADGAVGDGQAGGDNMAALQERMAGDDDPWYSPSEGKVVDKDGEVVVDPNTGLPFKSMESYQAWQAKQAPANTAKPKQDAAAQTAKPMAKSFDALMGATENGLAAEKLYELGKVGSDYAYADDLVPKIDPAAKAAAEAQQPVDPVERVKSVKQNLENATVAPIQKIRSALLQQGADAGLVDQLLAPILQEQQKMVDTYYQTEYEKALLERIDSKYAPQQNKMEAEKVSNAANANIQQLAQKYYPQGGKEAFFSLINGHYDEAGKFVRGPSAQVIDLLASVAGDGKPHASEEARTGAYKDMFEKLMSDPAKSKAVFDIAHYYWLGKQSHKAQAMIYERGKQAAAAQNNLKQRTIKTKPGSFTAPATDDEEKGMPTLLKYALQGAR